MDNELGNFINENFISIKINGKKDEGPDIKKNLNVYGYPTIVFIDPDGTELDRISGWDGNKENFSETLKDYLQGIGTLKALLAELKSDQSNVELNYKMAEKYVSRWEGAKAAAYYQQVLKLDPQDTKNYAEKAKCYIAMDQIWTNKAPEALEEFIKSCKNHELLKESFSTLVRYYENQKDSPNTLRIYDQYLSAFSDDTGVMNGFAWYIYEQRLTDQYAKGIEMARKAVDLEPEAAHVWDTLAWLYYESGDYNAAVKAMDKAVDLAPETEDFQKSLATFKKALAS